MSVTQVEARRPAVTCRAWLDACAAFEDARVTCGDRDLLRMAAFLERVSTALWASDSRACHLAAIHATQIARLLIAPGTPLSVSRAVRASELEGTALDVSDALDDADRPLADPKTGSAHDGQPPLGRHRPDGARATAPVRSARRHAPSAHDALRRP